ncbi:MCM2/3/5 family-domain-containing protein [Catenaria anguillulae PL171]|uniref:DNA replication licensing factor MCM4 n=1 Tax=Catenaria anguillulae PL171 TaxID=765915 RepID=A0A1Y2I111_9FUNG|nr:MCM2/3/5 family-domain-containing protein [Catenaria anguillulae PL171]
MSSSPMRQLTAWDQPSSPGRTPSSSGVGVGVGVGPGSSGSNGPGGMPGSSGSNRSSMRMPSSSLGMPSSRNGLDALGSQGSNYTPGFFGSAGRAVDQEAIRQWAQSTQLGAQDPNANPDQVDPTSQKRLIWGTNISIVDTISQFKDFLVHFTPRHAKRYRRALELGVDVDQVMDAGMVLEDDDYEPYYPVLLQQLKDSMTNILNLDTANLRAYPPTQMLYDHLLKYPHEVISIMDVTVTDYFQRYCLGIDVDAMGGADAAAADAAELEAMSLSVRPYNLQDSISLRDLNPWDIDRLITIKGLMIRSTPVIPDLKIGMFKCLVCDTTQEVELDRGRIEEPTRCPHADCGALNTMQLYHNRCRFASKQVGKLQETPDMIPDGQTPYTATLNLYDDLVDIVKPGDRVIVTGIFRSMPVRVNSRQRTIRPVFRTFIDVVHVRLVDPARVAKDESAVEANEFVPPSADRDSTEFMITDQEAAEIQNMSMRPDLYDYLARSIAPSIYEMEDAKKGTLLQLFGGHHKTVGTARYRGDINVLLVGDPGVAKSQLLHSAVGLTASVVRDPDTNAMVLESGALVLSDGGVCCIDEFDKMSDATRAILHEVMEQQTISVAKAGIITTLNARTSILASANPIKSKFDLNLSLVENINLVPSLLSRFDLLFVILDLPDEAYDRRLARHLVELYMEDRPDSGAAAAGLDVCPAHMLTKYISYAKKNMARTHLCEMRSLGSAHGNGNGQRTVTATTRQLESMIRLSEAHAKMRLSAYVEEEDVKEAARLLREAIKQGATDPKTGRIDLICSCQVAQSRRPRR